MRLLAVVLVLAACATPAVAQNAPPSSPTPPASQSANMRAGVEHFDKAFFQLTPQKRVEEANAEFAQAIAAFEREVAAVPSSAVAHRYLARIYAARKDFKKAAAHYDKVAAIEPLDVDACVLAALAYIDANQVNEATLRLLDAKTRTADPIALARLDEYLAKVDALKR